MLGGLGVVGVACCGFVKLVGVVCGGGFDRVHCDWFHLLVWGLLWGFRCCLACVWGFGCGSVMIGVTPDIGCVWLTMLLQ